MSPRLVDTLAALALPRRLYPLVGLGAVMLAAQAWLAADPRATAGGVLALIGFALTSPHLWRRWRPLYPPRPGDPRAGLALVVLGLAPVAAGMLVPHGQGDLWTAGLNGLVVAGLYEVGGWGLARDIELEAQSAALARQAEHAELLALKAQLDPHFLFNTLNAIASWCGEDPAQAEAAILRLADLLRKLLTGVSTPTWSLGEELALVRDVCALWAVRDPVRFGVDWLADDPPAVDVPPFLLLPVVENAYTHGPGAGHRGRVSVAWELEGEGVVVIIRNPGAYAGLRTGGAGIPLADRRAALAGGSFTICAVACGTEARVYLPRGRDAGRRRSDAGPHRG